MKFFFEPQKLNLFKKIKKFFYTKILKRKYFRYGKCAKCGACCKNIYVRHGKNIIKTKEEFEKIKSSDSYSFYQHISVIGADDFGLIFKCDKFDEEKNLCSEHKNRPPICKNYPNEAIFSFGAALQENCGYRFEPIESFREVFEKVNKNPVKEFEKIN